MLKCMKRRYIKYYPTGTHGVGLRTACIPVQQLTNVKEQCLKTASKVVSYRMAAVLNLLRLADHLVNLISIYLNITRVLNELH